MSKFTLCISVLALALSAVAHADAVDGSGAMCDRSITFDRLTAAEKTAINKYGQVARHVPMNNGYYMSYIFAEAPFDAELAMGVYSSCGEHAGNMGNFIKESQIVTRGNPFRVFYRQHVSWPMSDGRYTVENTLRAEQGGFILSSKLIDSTDADFSPRWSDGYVRMVPKGNGIFVVACNYMVPRSTGFKGKFNDTARERIEASGHNLVNWVKRVSQNSGLAQKYRDRLKGWAK